MFHLTSDSSVPLMLPDKDYTSVIKIKSEEEQTVGRGRKNAKALK